MPETIVVREGRPEDAAGIARVHVDSWRTTYPGIMPADALARLSYAARERYWMGILTSPSERHQAVFVAEDPEDGEDTKDAHDAKDGEDSRIVGFASCGQAGGAAPPAYQGELYTIYLLQSHQRMGIGRRLFRQVVERLAQDGHASMFVWVARDNPSRGFYEALGGKLELERRDEIFGQPIDEAGYGWPDIQSLRARLGRDGVPDAPDAPNVPDVRGGAGATRRTLSRPNP